MQHLDGTARVCLKAEQLQTSMCTPFYKTTARDLKVPLPLHGNISADRELQQRSSSSRHILKNWTALQPTFSTPHASPFSSNPILKTFGYFCPVLGDSGEERNQKALVQECAAMQACTSNFSIMRKSELQTVILTLRHKPKKPKIFKCSSKLQENNKCEIDLI